MKPVTEMLRDGASVAIVLPTMPKRPRLEQDQVWSEGLTRMVSAIARQTNSAVKTVAQRVIGGQFSLLFEEPIDVAEGYFKAEVRLSRSREEGERKRQLWLMDLLVKCGEARGAGFGTLMEYPPAAAMLADAPEEMAADG